MTRGDPHRVRSMAGFTTHVGRGLRRLATDAVVGQRVAFPRRIADLTAEALTTIMGRTVSSVRVLDGSAGTSSRARLALDGVDVPASVFVKMSAETAVVRMLGELACLGENEARFYERLAPELSGVPESFGSAFDRTTGRYVVVLEDMTLDACEFFDTLRPINTDKASLLVELLAHVHGAFWNRLPTAAGSGPLGWLTPISEERSLPITRPLMRLSAKRLADASSVPVEDGRFVIEHYPAIVRHLDSGLHTVLHGDSHPGNVFFREGKAGLLDWQVVKRGHPARDLAYSLITGMATNERRTSQRELLDVYRTALAAGGGPELDRDELWNWYRQAAVQPFLAALTTAGLGGMQSEDIALEGLRRAVDAFGDLDTVAVLQKSL